VDHDPTQPGPPVVVVIPLVDVVRELWFISLLYIVDRQRCVLIARRGAFEGMNINDTAAEFTSCLLLIADTVLYCIVIVIVIVLGT